MILEKLGIPENLIDSAKKIWDDTIINVNRDYNKLIKKGEISYKVDGVKIGEFDIEETNIIFNTNIVNSIDTPHINGMSIVSRTIRKKIDKFEYIIADPIVIHVDIIMGPNNNKKDLMDLIYGNKIEMISSFAHELKHRYDSNKKNIQNIKNDIDYVDLDEFLSKIRSMNEFFYLMYYSHSVENLVRSTEVGTAIQISGVNKNDFLEFLKSNRTYTTLDDMSKYNIEDFKNNLKRDHDKIKETLEDLGIKTGTEQENINNILLVFLKVFMNYKIDRLRGHISKLPPLILNFGHKELDEILAYIQDNFFKFRNNPIDFFEKQIKIINLVGNKYKKKLHKLYDIIEDYPVDDINRKINRKINNFKDFKYE